MTTKEMDTFLKASADTFIKNPTKEMAESVIMLTAAILTSLKTQDETTEPHKDNGTHTELCEELDAGGGGDESETQSSTIPLNYMFVKDLDTKYIEEKYKYHHSVDTMCGGENTTLFSPNNAPHHIWENKKSYDYTKDKDRLFVLRCIKQRELFHTYARPKIYKLWRAITLHAVDGCVDLETLISDGFKRNEIDELTSLQRVGQRRYEDSGKFRVAKHFVKKDGSYEWIVLEPEFW